MAKSHPGLLTLDLAEYNTTILSENRVRDWEPSTLDAIRPYRVLVARLCKRKSKEKSRPAHKATIPCPAPPSLLNHAA